MRRFRRVGIHFDGVRAACFRGVQQSRRRVDDTRRPHRQEHITGGCGVRARRNVGIDRFAEPHDRGPREPAARGAQRRERLDGDAEVFPFRRAALAGAAQPPDRSVIPQHLPCARALVQAVHVLGHEREAVARTPTRDDRVRGVRLGRRDQAAPPVVPFPDQRRIARERMRSRELFGAERSPQAARSAEGRHATGRRDARARDDRDRARACDARGNRFEGWAHVTVDCIVRRYRRQGPARVAPPCASTTATGNRIASPAQPSLQ